MACLAPPPPPQPQTQTTRYSKKNRQTDCWLRTRRSDYYYCQHQQQQQQQKVKGLNRKALQKETELLSSFAFAFLPPFHSCRLLLLYFSSDDFNNNKSLAKRERERPILCTILLWLIIVCLRWPVSQSPRPKQHFSLAHLSTIIPSFF